MIQPCPSEHVTVNLEAKGLITVPIGINPNVSELNLDDNSIRRLETDSLETLPFVEILRINSNGLAYIDQLAFANNINLFHLEMTGHNFPTFPSILGGASTWMGKMSGGGKPIKEFVFRNFRQLNYLSMNINSIASGQLILQELPNLQYLSAQKCQLTEFPNLSEAPKLVTVRLQYNAIAEIPQSTIQGLTLLRTLAINNCRVSHLPDLSHMTSLDKLNVRNNRLTTLPDLYNLPLNKLYWSGNPMECNRDLCWIRMWDYVKPSLITEDDERPCAAPMELSDRLWSDIHPTEMKCFRGIYRQSPYTVKCRYNVVQFFTILHTALR